MKHKERDRNPTLLPIDDAALLAALTALGRAINIISTYGNHHPAFHQAIQAALVAMETLFLDRRKINIGAFNGIMLVDETPIQATGTLLKSLERRLVRLRITGLRIASGISEAELTQLAELLATNEAAEFTEGISRAKLAHIATESTRYQAVKDDETVAKERDLARAAEMGILVLDEESGYENSEGTDGDGASVHVEQIVAFLKGDINLDDADLGEELTKLASDPARLGQMIMESVSIRQAASELSGESLNDIVLGCLRRTFDGLRQQPAFQSSEGIADLKKSLLLLEETMLDKIRNLTGGSDPVLDRQIVQAIREMDENLSFELAATQYVEHHEAILENEKQLQSYVKTNGAGAAEELIAHTEFPPTDWRRIVVESGGAARAEQPLILAGLNSLTTVFEKLENLMKSDGADGGQVQNLLGQATDNIDVTADSTKEKLEELSRQLDDTGTIGGQAQIMNRKELLSSISEISQELMQPLTAINASLEMMLHGYVGEVNQEQRTMLELASNSGIHLTYLMKELIAIVGCPTNKGVDERFHTTSEEVILLEKKAG